MKPSLGLKAMSKRQSLRDLEYYDSSLSQNPKEFSDVLKGYFPAGLVLQNEECADEIKTVVREYPEVRL